MGHANLNAPPSVPVPPRRSPASLDWGSLFVPTPEEASILRACFGNPVEGAMRAALPATRDAIARRER